MTEAKDQNGMASQYGQIFPTTEFGEHIMH